MQSALLELKNITKVFSEFRILDDISLQVEENSIHAIVGENKAGKTTLMKILNGYYPYGHYEGEIFLRGEQQRFHSIRESEQSGVSVIYHELALVKQLSVSENLFLGHEVAERGIINWNKSFSRAKSALEEVGLQVSPVDSINQLSGRQQLFLEIARALIRDCRILILDEPSLFLTRPECEELFVLVRKLKQKGITCIYVSKKLYEVFELADRVTVIREGRVVVTKDLKDVNENQIRAMMDGRDLVIADPRKASRYRGNGIIDAEFEEIVDEDNKYIISGFPKSEINDLTENIAGLMKALKKPLEQIVKLMERDTEEGRKIKTLLEYFKQKETYLHRIAIKSQGAYEIIDVREIEFIRSEEGLVFIHLLGRRLLFDVPLSTIEKKLDPSDFFRIHRNTIVNLRKIKKVEPLGKGVYRVEMDFGDRIQVSRARALEFREKIGIQLD